MITKADLRFRRMPDDFLASILSHFCFPLSALYQMCIPHYWHKLASEVMIHSTYK